MVYFDCTLEILKYIFLHLFSDICDEWLGYTEGKSWGNNHPSLVNRKKKVKYTDQSRFSLKQKEYTMVK